MARQESDREDLLGEATALIDRIELRLPERDDPIFVGFRRSGAGSVFFGADPVFQFNSSDEFRRGYHSGHLLKSERGQIVQLTRERHSGQVRLVREVWDAEQTRTFLESMGVQLLALRATLQGGQYALVGQVSQDPELLTRIQNWLQRCGENPRIAERPNAV